MADANSSSSEIRQYISFENYNIASNKIKQLDAMISAITGEGFAHFQSMDDDAQHWFLLTISDFSMDIKRIFLDEGEGEASHA